MKFEKFRQAVRKRPVFTPDELHMIGKAAKHEFVQLCKWARTGKIIRVRKGLYTMPEPERAVPLNFMWLANRIYEPSYISLEYALSYYDLIPEAAGSVTSISTRKSKVFKTPLGVFRYSALKSQNFFGFISVTSPEGQPFWIATPEKAVIDFLYLRVTRRETVTKDLFLTGYRFQNLERLNRKVFTETINRFSVKTVKKAARVFLGLLKKGKANA
jgi:predicted transcriptional regulator of viral defense system